MDVINPHRFSTATPAVDFDGFGNASRYFDGVSDYITVPDGSWLPTGAQTWCCWIKVNVMGTDAVFNHNVGTGNQRSVNLITVSNGAVEFVLSQDGANSQKAGTAASTITTGQWYHIAGTFEPSTSIKLYINGVLAATNTTSIISSVLDSTADVGIGANGLGQAPFDGNIADCRIYNSALSSTDIAALYGGKNITTNLIGHWLKDTPSLLDHSGTNDGTNVGSAFAYDNPSPAVEFGKASRYFDGVNDYIDPNASFNTTFQSAFSFACWVRFADGTPATGFVIFGNQENSPISRWLFLLGTDGKIQSNYHSNGNTSFAKINTAFSNGDTGWMHLACVITPSGQTLYLNGSQATLDPTQTGDMSGVTMGDYDSTRKCFIGARSFNDSPSLYLNGNIADVRIYDTTLSAQDIFDISRGYDYRTNLIGHWLTNKDDVDDYAGVNDGTNNGSTYSFDNPLSEGEFGSASRSFDGVDDYISIPDINESNTAFSAMCWVKTTAVDWSNTYFAHWDNTLDQRGWVMLPSQTAETNGKKLMVFISDDGSASSSKTKRYYGTTDVSDGTWHHCAFTWDNGTLKLYVDGIEETTTKVWNASFTSILNSSGPLSIGAVNPTIGGSSFIDGHIADCRIYDTALGAQDIFDLSRGYDYRTNLIGQWLTNKDDVDDYAGTNHGTNNGSTYSQDAPL